VNDFEEIIEQLNKFHKNQEKMKHDSIVRFLDHWIKDCEEHKDKFNYDVGVNTGMIRAFKIVKDYIKD